MKDNINDRLNNLSDDSFFQKLARSYAETEGRQLKEELEHTPRHSTPLMDRRVRQRIKAGRTRGLNLKFGVLAACLVVALLIIPLVLRSGAPGLNLSSVQNPASPDSASPDSASPDPTLIPISFTLPATLSHSSSRTDNGESIHYLKDINADDVVLTMEQTSRKPATNNLTPVTINGKTAWVRETADYKYLTFSHSGILYTMTCRYDLNTLITLGKNIL